MAYSLNAMERSCNVSAALRPPRLQSHCHIQPNSHCGNEALQWRNMELETQCEEPQWSTSPTMAFKQSFQITVYSSPHRLEASF